jgi:1-acyl-sn-glycerol-3-phosphate acyltransferase
MLDALDRVWRLFGTGLFLAIIGVGGSLLALTLFPLITLVTRNRERRRLRIQYLLYLNFKVYCGLIRWLRFADIEISGGERLQGLTGTLIVANHPSLLDVVMIMAAVPNVQCVVKAGLWWNPFFRLTVGGAGFIPNDLDGVAMVEACVATLKAGNNLIIFPEGTRSRLGQPIRFRRGFANIATLAEADLQLLIITCDPPILHKGNPWWRVPNTRSAFKLVVGERLDIRPFLGYRYRSVGVRKLVSSLEGYYTEKLGHGRT